MALLKTHTKYSSNKSSGVRSQNFILYNCVFAVEIFPTNCPNHFTHVGKLGSSSSGSLFFQSSYSVVSESFNPGA